VTVNSLPTISVNSASICLGQQTATLTANGASTYSWIPGTGLSSTTGSVVTGTPGSAQNYTVVGMDVNGCLNGTITSIFVHALPTITVNSATICLGQQTATLTANNAATYTWSPATGLNVATGAAVTGTPTSTQSYTVTGTDVNGCYGDATSTIVVNATPTITVNSATICLGQQTATLSANGADTYTWSPGTGLSSINAGTVTGTPVATENYTVTGTDVNGCYASNTATISVSPIPTVTVADTTICPGSSATLNASGATNYTWTPNQFLNTAFNGTVISTPSVTTTYTIDAETASCVTSTFVTVTVSNTVVVNASASTPTICPLASSSLTATGAASYTWTPAISLNTNTGGTVVATPSADETYTVIGATGTCTNSAQVVITVTVNPTVTVAGVAPICSSSGTAALAANGASTYTWSPNTALSTTVGANVNANPSTTQTYTVNGTSPLGCTNFTTITVTVVPTPTITTLANPLTICDGSVSVLSAFGATDYTWSPSADLSSANGSQVNASPSISTLFTVTGSNGTAPDLCFSTNTVAVTVLPKTPAIPGPVDPICFGTSTSIYATGGNTYQWQPSVGVSNPTDSTTYVSPVATTVYTVTVSRNGLCPSTATIEVVVNPLPEVDAGRDTTINIDEVYVLHGTGNVDVGFLSPDGVPLICNYCPVVEVAPDENTCYTLKGENTYGCVATDVVCIEVTRDWNVYIPNAFSPNGDLDNDIFIPVGYGLEEIKLTIFDRWGEVIFKSNGDKIGWDGNSKSGKPCEQNVYVYLAEIKTMAGNTVKRTGHVTLLSRVK
jgi:gliding motility-associated-like protein